MAGGHGGGIAYKDLTMHKAKRWHTITRKGLCAVMWLVLYRAKQDSPLVLVRLDSLSRWRYP
ncbi:NADH dehydrogenase [Salix suchowensis]|nr:NADH dehydrogenase [Salix suchowensis]